MWNIYNDSDVSVIKFKISFESKDEAILFTTTPI